MSCCCPIGRPPAKPPPTSARVVSVKKEERGAKGSGATVLGEGLLEITDFLDQNIHGDGVGVGDPVDLGLDAGTTHQLASVGHETGRCNTNVFVDLEHLLDGLGDDETGDDALVADEHHAVTELQARSRRPSLDGFPCVFHLEEAAVWAEGGNAVVVASSAGLHDAASKTAAPPTVEPRVHPI